MLRQAQVLRQAQDEGLGLILILSLSKDGWRAPSNQASKRLPSTEFRILLVRWGPQRNIWQAVFQRSDGAMTETSTATETNADPHARWKFMRDVIVFESKLALNNLHNFFQIPVTLAVAVFDLIFKGKEEGERFYKLLEMGRTIDDSIDIYSVIAHREKSLNKNFTVDAVVARIESVIVKEYEKGGTAASVKQAVDKAFDGMQAKTGEHAEKVTDAMKAAAEKLQKKMRDLGKNEG
jgi:hypothetical protein